jgi:hypothetical protein
MGFWDLLLFNIAAVLGPRWIAAAAHNGTSSISLWVLAAVGFFVPTAMVIVELTSRFPQEGGLYAWSKDAFGDFHGFVAGWTYWIYTIFYFPALLLASASMSAYVAGPSGEALAQNRAFLLVGSFVLLIVAVGMNLVGLNIGKWLQNAGGVSTYLPLLILAALAFILVRAHGSLTHFSLTNMMPHWNWGTVNFWPQIAFAFTGLEIGSMMSEADVSARDFRIGRADCGDLHRRHAGGPVVAAGGGRGYQERGVSGNHHRIDDAAHRVCGDSGGDAGLRGKRGRGGQHGRGSFAGAVRGGAGPLPAGGLRKNPSEMENAVRGNSGAGGYFRRDPAGYADQRDGE